MKHSMIGVKLELSGVDLASISLISLSLEDTSMYWGFLADLLGKTTLRSWRTKPVFSFHGQPASVT